MAGTVSVSLRKSLFARLLPYLLIAPTLILVFIFTVYPAINSVVDSLYKPARNARDPSEYVGLENYVDLFNPDHYIGSAFVQIIGQTLTFSIVTVLVSVPLALLFALLLNRKMPLQGVWRFSLFYPSLLPLIGAASIWAFLFSDTVGLINTVVRSFGGRGANWIGDPNISLWAVIVVNIWKQVGYYMIFYLAGLQGISRDFYEAAELDGANGWQQFAFSRCRSCAARHCSFSSSRLRSPSRPSSSYRCSAWVVPVTAAISCCFTSSRRFPSGGTGAMLTPCRSCSC
ncbi:MAG: sugar ABC transporter permease [Chloroflexi bacterium]|nr:sugar ABC transporter permease [Chloroflexota bacterium]